MTLPHMLCKGGEQQARAVVRENSGESPREAAKRRMKKMDEMKTRLEVCIAAIVGGPTLLLARKYSRNLSAAGFSVDPSSDSCHRPFVPQRFDKSPEAGLTPRQSNQTKRPGGAPC